MAMLSLRRSDPLPSQLGRIAHDLGLAGLLGGNLFGRMAFHPAVAAISDKSERGKVVNAAWRRYGVGQLARDRGADRPARGHQRRAR